MLYIENVHGTGGRVWTYASGSQSPLPYRLATPVYCVLRPRIPILHRGHPTHFWDRQDMAYFIYRSVTTTKYTKGETFHVFMRETNVSLEWEGGVEPLSAEPEATVFNR